MVDPVEGGIELNSGYVFKGEEEIIREFDEVFEFGLGVGWVERIWYGADIDEMFLDSPIKAILGSSAEDFVDDWGKYRVNGAFAEPGKGRYKRN